MSPNRKNRNKPYLWLCPWRCCSFLGVAATCCCCSRDAKGASKSVQMRTFLCALLGVLLVALGVALFPMSSHIRNYLINKEFQLSPTSKSFEIWRETPVPLHIDFYFWNWTNPEDILVTGAKPKFVEMGPYRFKETKEKVNITWNSNGTVSFRQLRRWYFDAENSNGTLADNITTVNVVALTASSVVRYWFGLLQRSVSLAVDTSGQKVHITHTAGEFLFDGFWDPLITVAQNVPGLSDINIPFDKFGWFYKRNGSVYHDGVFNMRTGALDMTRLGELTSWNYANKTVYYEGGCAHIRGSAGELWPPYRTSEDSISLFSPELCRSLTLYYSGQAKVMGVQGLKYSGGKLLMDNGDLDADNRCYCNGQCLPSGVVNVTSCRYGAPAFVSFPHFYLADPPYREAVVGMNPSAQRHSLYITLEPTTGIPLDVAARFQINMFLSKNPYVSLFRDLPELIMPIMWFEQRASITPELLVPLQILLNLPLIISIVVVLMIVSGLWMLLASLVARTGCCQTRSSPTSPLPQKSSTAGETVSLRAPHDGIEGVPRPSAPTPTPPPLPVQDGATPLLTDV